MKIVDTLYLIWFREFIRGSGLISEHSLGTAVGVSAIVGAVVSKHWRGKGNNGEKLRKAASAACKHFSNVLTSKTNKLHRDHFHLDNGIGFQCNVKAKLKLAKW